MFPFVSVCQGFAKVPLIVKCRLFEIRKNLHEHRPGKVNCRTGKPPTDAHTRAMTMDNARELWWRIQMHARPEVAKDVRPLDSSVASLLYHAS